MILPCTSCGSCCRRIKNAVSHFYTEDNKDPLYFPYTWDENGVCENLTEDNKCKVYENRPLLCNIDKFATYFKINKKSFIKENIDACNQLMDIDKVPIEFRIKQL
jgi:hypothetical protein